MNIELPQSDFTKPLSAFLHRYHVLIFALLVVGGLAFATFQLYRVIIESSSPPNTTANNSFDQTTIDQIKQLRGTNDPAAPLSLPAGRANPFE